MENKDNVSRRTFIKGTSAATAAAVAAPMFVPKKAFAARQDRWMSAVRRAEWQH